MYRLILSAIVAFAFTIGIDISAPNIVSVSKAEAACLVKKVCGSWGETKKVQKKKHAYKPKPATKPYKAAKKKSSKKVARVSSCSFVSFGQKSTTTPIVFAQDASAFNCGENTGIAPCINCEAWINCRRGFNNERKMTPDAHAFCENGGGVARTSGNRAGIWVKKSYQGLLAWCDPFRTPSNAVVALNY